MKANLLRLLLLAAVVGSVSLFFALDLNQHLTLSRLKAQQEAFDMFYDRHTVLTLAVYMGLYIAVTALSLPGAAVMTLAGGALFGLWAGLLAVSFASTIGATLAFLAARFLLKGYVQNRFGDRLKRIMAEANRYAAGQWRRARAPERVLNWLGRFHRWQRR